MYSYLECVTEEGFKATGKVTLEDYIDNEEATGKTEEKEEDEETKTDIFIKTNDNLMNEIISSKEFDNIVDMVSERDLDTLETVLKTCNDFSIVSSDKEGDTKTVNNYIDKLNSVTEGFKFNEYKSAVSTKSKDRPKPLISFVVPLNHDDECDTYGDNENLALVKTSVAIDNSHEIYIHDGEKVIDEAMCSKYCYKLSLITGDSKTNVEDLQMSALAGFLSYKVSVEEKEKNRIRSLTDDSSERVLNRSFKYYDTADSNFIEGLENCNSIEIPLEDMLYKVEDLKFFEEMQDETLKDLEQIYKLVKKDKFLSFAYRLFNITHLLKHHIGFNRNYLRVLSTLSNDVAMIVGAGPSLVGSTTLVPIQFIGTLSKDYFDKCVLPNFTFYMISISFDKNDKEVVSFITTVYRYSKEQIDLYHSLYNKLLMTSVYIGESYCEDKSMLSMLEKHIEMDFFAGLTTDSETCAFLDYIKYLYPLICGKKAILSEILESRFPKSIVSMQSLYFLKKLLPNLVNISENYSLVVVLDEDTGYKENIQKYLTPISGIITDNPQIVIKEINIVKLVGTFHKSSFHALASTLETIIEFEKKGKDTPQTYGVDIGDYEDSVDGSFLNYISDKIDSVETFDEEDLFTDSALDDLLD
jgi:hypothetical protein